MTTPTDSPPSGSLDADGLRRTATMLARITEYELGRLAGGDAEVCAKITLAVEALKDVADTARERGTNVKPT